MISRHIAYTNKAKKQLLSLPEKMQRRMVSAIDELESPDADREKAKKLKGQKKNEPSIYRIRVGSYRALYTVDENDENDEVIIHHIGHRKDVYKKGK